jgi:hypothetical protein
MRFGHCRSRPKLFEEDLTAKEAARRIEALQREIELADSF